MKKTISGLLAMGLSLTVINVSMAEGSNRKETKTVEYFTEVVDPDPDLSTFSKKDQEKYRDLPEEQEQVAAIPSKISDEPDPKVLKSVAESVPNVAVKPPQ